LLQLFVGFIVLMINNINRWCQIINFSCCVGVIGIGRNRQQNFKFINMWTIKSTSTNWRSFMRLTCNNFMALLVLLTILANNNNNNTSALIVAIGGKHHHLWHLFKFSFYCCCCNFAYWQKFNWILLSLYCVLILHLCFIYFGVAKELFFKNLISATSRSHVHVRFGSFRFKTQVIECHGAH